MIVPGSANPLLLGQSTGYNLTRSLRLRGSASAYLSRTPASSGSTSTWTYSAWVKRGALGSGVYPLLTSYTDTSNYSVIDFSADCLRVLNNTSATGEQGKVTTQVFRDPSAWYHIVVSASGTTLNIYVNGTQVTSFSTNTSVTGAWKFNSTTAQWIGREQYSATNNYFDGYVTEQNWIDGQALTPSSFGETNAQTGVWQPKKYAGTYGTNGFYLPFTDNSALTSGSNAGLGKDFSGNGNYWNTNNISITSGATYDSMTDVPTLTSATAANFAVINPLWKDSGVTVANGNLSVSGGNYGGFSTLTIPTNSKFYAEFTVTTTEGNQGVGILKATNAYSGVLSQADMFGSNSVTYYSTNGNKYVLGGGSTAYGSSWGTVGDVIGIAVNTVDNQITFYKNNTSQGTITGLTSGIEWVFATGNQTSDGGGAWNFGQRPFAYTPPTGFVALNTYNLPTPTIGATASTLAGKYMDTTTYTGTGSTQSIVNSGSMQPDMVWIKIRSTADSHIISDSVRGISGTGSPVLFPNGTGAEATFTGFGISALNSNGFTLIGNGSLSNSSGQNYVAWQWKANGSGSSNTAGSITSTVSANTSAGFSVVTYTGNGSSGATIGHGLGVAPKMVIVKPRSISDNWRVYHVGNNAGVNPQNYNINLNSTAAAALNSAFWNNTAPSSTVFTVGNDGGINGSGTTYVAYCFAEVAGYSKFGSYTGNGSTDGPFVYCGFRPRYIMYKRSSDVGNWQIMDTARWTYNTMDGCLFPNLSNAETFASSLAIDLVSNGFKLRNTDSDRNANGSTYIYMAFAENPFKYSLAR